MGNYQAYEKYKDSGVKWLGDIPKHWKKSVFRYYFDIQLGKMLQNESQSEHDEEISYLKAIHVRWDKVNIDDLPKMWTSPREKEKYSVRNGDLLISEGGEVGRTALLKDLHEDCIIQNAVHRVRALSQSKVEYLNYLMRHIADTKWLDILCNKSTIAHLTSEKLGALPLPLPPLDEQELIANFLDRKTKQIDDLIAKKEALLAKLDEKRSAIISHAVTKGLDPTVPMKDSGIEWLGDIPKHWEALKIKRLTAIKRGASPRPIDDPKYFDDDGEYSWVRIDDVTASERYLENTTQRLSELGKSFSVPLEPDKLFLSIAGSVGKPMITKIKCCIHDGFVYFPDLKISKELIYYIFYSGQPYLGLGKLGTQLNLNTETVGAITIGLPPLDKQDAIIKYLDKKTVEINLQKAKVQEAIERLKEYRTALITNAVTGKIDVRQVSLN